MKLAFLILALLLVWIPQSGRAANSPANPPIPSRPPNCPDALIAAWENWRRYRTPVPNEVLDELLALTQISPFRLQEAARCLAYFNTSGAPLNNENQALMMRELYRIFNRDDVRKSPQCLENQVDRVNRLTVPPEYTDAHIVNTQTVIGFGRSCSQAADNFWKDVQGALEKLKNNPPSNCVSDATRLATYVVAPMPKDPTLTELCCYNQPTANYRTPEWKMTGWCLKKPRPLEEVMMHFLNECTAKVNGLAGYVANSASLVVHKNEVPEEYAELQAREKLACTNPQSLEILDHYTHFIVENAKQVKLDIYCTAKKQCLDKTAPAKQTPVKPPTKATDPLKTSTQVPSDNSNALPTPRPTNALPSDAQKMK